MPNQKILPFLVIAFGVIVVSAAALMIRLAQETGAGSLAIAAGRLGIAALLLTPIAWLRQGAELRCIERRDLWPALGSGAFLALHFGAWISSLAYTSVASSVALVSTNPIWVGLASLLLLRERLQPGMIAGILLTFAGSICIVLSDSSPAAAQLQPAPLLGNALALLGAVGVTGYFLIGRGLRERIPLLSYVWLVYTTAAVLLLLAAWIAGQQLFGLHPPAYLAILALALGPQLLGHTSFNWALRRLSATFVAVAILGEPIGATLLALEFLDEGFAPLQLAGFVLLLAGIAVATLAERHNQAIEPTDGSGHEVQRSR
jgi:drug/metabolite transporter (DMT)-like permease